MHILFLTDNFIPEVNAPAIRTYEHAKVWIEQGHKVTIITCFPNYPEGKIYDGYKNKLYEYEDYEGIKVVRVWTYMSRNRGIFLRLLDQLSFMISSFIASFFIKSFDIIISTSPQFFTTISGYFVSLIRKKPWVFELRDIWSDSLSAVGYKYNILIRSVRFLEKFFYKRARLIVPVTNNFKKILINLGINKKKIKVITNGINLSKFSPIPKNKDLILKYNLENKFVLGYIGTLGMAHSIETLLDAIKSLERDYGNEISMIIVGEGANKEFLLSHLERLKIRNVHFIDRVSHEEIIKYWSIIDTSIIHLKNVEEFHSVIPSKLFESVAMGKPILLGLKGETAEIVLSKDVGVLFEPEDSKDLKEKIVYFFENKDLLPKYKKNGIKLAVEYDRKNLALLMLEELKQIV
ncbi:MAG: glycosyltransferase WbuB [Dehalococcoidia bacterium]|nr:glycosyltransferase WbuB [Dehalococcoidia bacterium]|tara:strand:- start:4303 stop:5520 length:1218 start_codon:yes stop_codon:yes gene_type:complete